MNVYTGRFRRISCVFLKSMREMNRDWLSLSLTLVFAPLFVLLWWLFTAGGSTTYKVAVINRDLGAVLPDGGTFSAGEDVIAGIDSMAYANGEALLKTVPAADRAEVEKLLKDRKVVAFLLLPEDFSQRILAMQAGSLVGGMPVTFGGDLTNPYYIVGANLTLVAVEAYIQAVSDQQPLVQYVEEPVGGSAARTEFEIYIPGLLVFSEIMMVFLASMAIAREAEAGTLRRLQITRLTSLEFMIGVSAALTLIGLVGLFLTYGAALGMGFRSQGPLWAAILVGVLTGLSIIGTGLVVAAFSSSVSQAFVIANFPLGLFMFFTGVIYPIPGVTLFTIAGRVISLYDILPPTHAVVALNKIFTMGAGAGEILYELGSLLFLSLLYFALGIWLFQRLRMKAA